MSARARTQAFALRPRPPFELGLALFGHGWVDLAPHRWDSERGVLETVLELDGRGVDVSVSETGVGLRVRSTGSARQRPALRRALARMLRLDEDFAPFWRVCAGEPSLRWVSRRGGGRLLRAPSLFEDLAKLLMTTNCSWAATRNMAERLTGALGAEAPSGRRAFPSASACAGQSERFYRDEVRMGYRAGAMQKLARQFAAGERDADFEDPAVDTEALRERLLELPGFGPYAAGQALRLLGRYEDFALDSWCRARLAARAKSGRVPSERSIARQYARFGAYRGLALWMDLTADWHGEGAPHRRQVLKSRP